MKFIKLFASDLKNGIVKVWFRFFLVFLFFILLALDLQTQGFAAQNIDPSTFSFGDYLLHAFSGIKEYFYTFRNPFRFPVFWFLTFLFATYLTLSYPYQDFLGIGQHLLVESGSRRAWWVSKCLWIVVTVILFYAVGALALLLVTFLSGGGLSAAISQNTPLLLDFGGGVLPQVGNIGDFLPICVLMTIAFCFLQLVLSLLTKPLPSFLCIASLLFFSAYYKAFFLSGNYLMAARSAVFIEGGFDTTQGFCLAIGIIVFTFVGGIILMRNIDLINKEKFRD